MNEFALINRYFRRPPRGDSVRIGVGDDAAVILPTPGMELVVSVDMLVEGRHFLRATDLLDRKDGDYVLESARELNAISATYPPARTLLERIKDGRMP